MEWRLAVARPALAPEKRMLIESGRTRVDAEAGEGGSSTRSVPYWSVHLFLVVVLAALGAVLELQTSWLQSRLFTGWTRDVTFSVEPGAAAGFRHPHSGPYDIRLGHSLLTEMTAALRRRGYVIDSQARVSPQMARIMDRNLSPTYREKVRAGLSITGHNGQVLYQSSFPDRVYPGFNAVPSLLVDTLMFIENREVLDDRYPYKNPAVEWDRLANAGIGLTLTRMGVDREVTGGSTLATQIEKMRHSPGGYTNSVGDKARQMLSASMRAYSGGAVTRDARRRIVTDYLNSIPLAAIPGYGEVHGIGDGLWAWFGSDFEIVNELLRNPRTGSGAVSPAEALAYRQVLTLLLAVKKPSAYLLREPADLEARVSGYLELLAREGVITAALRDRALAVRPRLRDRAERPRPDSYGRRKATDGVRIELLQDLGFASVYDLDRLDLSVESTLSPSAQRSVADYLENLHDPDFAARAGLNQHRLLSQGDPAGVIYSVVVYELGPDANYLRIQSDNLNQPLNINEGTKLELGSTAKLRTLASYLSAVSDLYDRLSKMSPEERLAASAAPEDRITRWAIEYLNQAPDSDLPAMLEAAMRRGYSASPRERFFTGGGLHRFSNFSAKFDNRWVTVREALEQSVNLAFVRLMRDLVHYRIYRLPGVGPGLLRNPGDPARYEYLSRFAEREGRQFLTRHFQKYEGLKQDEALRLIAADLPKTPRRLAAIYRLVRPEDGVDGFAAYLIGNLLDPTLSDELIRDLYEEFAPGGYSLADRAYIAGVDPLELWLLQYKSRHPAARLGDIYRDSGPHCQAAYNWLFLTKNRKAQDRAIRIMLEVDAFRVLHKEWRTLGYPFRWLVPSYATALGSSGDTPAALAELVGVIASGGVRKPGIRVERLHFAQDTPFETNLTRRPDGGQRVLRAEVANVLREELAGVVERGTGRRALGAVVATDGQPIEIGGKTGTGDNRYEVFNSSGHVIESRVVNRTATFMFLVGDRFFGTVTAFVPGESAADYGFTSSLPVQIFKELGPVFAALMEGEPSPDLAAAARARPLPALPSDPALQSESPDLDQTSADQTI